MRVDCIKESMSRRPKISLLDQSKFPARLSREFYP
jgi:hypothetical protein